MSNGEDRSVIVVVCLIAGGFALVGILYALVLFWPYLVFVVVPLVIGSTLVAMVLRLSTLPDEDGLLVFNYKRLAIAFPVLIFLVTVVFFAGATHVMIVDKKGIKIGIIPEWPKLYHAFNDERASDYAGSPFESLQERAKVSVNYDRESIGILALVCLFFGGPAIFWYLGRHDESSHRNAVLDEIGRRTKAYDESSSKREAKNAMVIEENLKAERLRFAELQREFSIVKAENLRLRATVEFSSPRPKRFNDPNGSSGILDKDIL